ncbi:hypothetical protein U3516DRAFT_656906, partial [Neocallimastix sp. 'constans']
MDSKSLESSKNNSHENINSSLDANSSTSNANNSNNKNRNNNKRNFRKNNSSKKSEASTSNDVDVNNNDNKKTNKNGRYRNYRNNDSNNKKAQDNTKSNEDTNDRNKNGNNENGESFSNENNGNGQKSNKNHFKNKNNKKYHDNVDTSDNDSNLDEKSSKNFKRNILMRKPKDFGKLTIEDSDSSSKDSLKQKNSEDNNYNNNNNNNNNNRHHRKENNRTHNQRLTNIEKVEIMTKKVTNASDQDLQFNLIVELTNSTYECMVCYNVVKPKDHIWSCSICYNVFHLNCIKKWARTDVSTAGKDGGWRCPGCQSAISEVPNKYTCFCGKIENPRFNPYITPHSCTNICGKPRDCSHPCREQCHPGPCPPCTLFAPEEKCYCGKKSYTYRCSDLQKNKQVIMEQKCCGEVCGKLLNCGKHTCKKLCHPGPCDDCEEKTTQTCYCGKETKEYECGKEHKYSCHTPCEYVYP